MRNVVLEAHVLVSHYFGDIPKGEKEFWLRYGEALWLEEREAKRFALTVSRLLGGADA